MIKFNIHTKFYLHAYINFHATILIPLYLVQSNINSKNLIIIEDCSSNKF
jgi:hypothetical protein